MEISLSLLSSRGDDALRCITMCWRCCSTLLLLLLLLSYCLPSAAMVTRGHKLKKLTCRDGARWPRRERQRSKRSKFFPANFNSSAKEIWRESSAARQSIRHASAIRSSREQHINIIATTLHQHRLRCPPAMGRG